MYRLETVRSHGDAKCLASILCTDVGEAVIFPGLPRCIQAKALDVKQLETKLVD
jgi:hypothetical protein